MAGNRTPAWKISPANIKSLEKQTHMHLEITQAPKHGRPIAETPKQPKTEQAEQVLHLIPQPKQKHTRISPHTRLRHSLGFHVMLDTRHEHLYDL